MGIKSLKESSPVWDDSLSILDNVKRNILLRESPLYGVLYPGEENALDRLKVYLYTELASQKGQWFL